MKYWIAILLIQLLFVGCKKKEAGQDDDSGIPVEGQITVKEKTVTTHQMVALGVKSKVSEQIAGKLGDHSVEIIGIDDSTAGFIVPAMPEGTYRLVSKLGQVELHVKASQSLSETETWATLDNALASLRNAVNTSSEEIEEVSRFQQEVIELYNKLSAKEKAEALSIYTANRALFNDFLSTLEDDVMQQQHAVSKQKMAYASDFSDRNIKGNLDARSNIMPIAQSDREKCFALYPSDLVKQYDCQAGKINSQYQGLSRSLADFTLFVTLTGTAITLSPATVGLSTITGSISATVAVYILIAELKPHINRMISSVGSFFVSKWVLIKENVSIKQQTFGSDLPLAIDDIYKQRPLQESDAFSNNFMVLKQSKIAVENAMSKFKSLFKKLPDYANNDTEAISSENIVWSVSEISNPKIKLKEVKANKITFTMDKDGEETFSYALSADYYGQKNTITVSAKYSKIDSTQIYQNAVLGNWSVRNVDPNGSTYNMTVHPGGKISYRTAEGTTYEANWQIVKRNGRYFLRDYGFWHPAFDGYRTYDTSLSNVALRYPVESFNVYTDFSSNGTDPRLALVYSR